MTTCAQYQTMLDDLEAAKQKILLGNKAVSFGHGENHQTNAAPDLAAIEREIRRLQMKVDACNGTSSAHRFIRTVPGDSC